MDEKQLQNIVSRIIARAKELHGDDPTLEQVAQVAFMVPYQAHERVLKKLEGLARGELGAASGASDIAQSIAFGRTDAYARAGSEVDLTMKSELLDMVTA